MLKRKRSESELSPVSSSGLGSPSKHDITMDMGGSRIATPAHLPSRTLKRFRNDRPPDEEVHQRTLNMLFTAQKQQQHQHDHQHHHQPDHQHDQPMSASTMDSPQPADAFVQAVFPGAMPKLPKCTRGAMNRLLDFSGSFDLFLQRLNIPEYPPVDCSIYDPTNCEDCGQRLGGVDGSVEDNGMDVDSFDVGVDTACSVCGKRVCSHCSITRLGEQRRCLICA
ncbi:hypothetical protein F4775DRAFT_555597, partial [Biscogniauxia sp. FL1348]